MLTRSSFWCFQLGPACIVRLEHLNEFFAAPGGGQETIFITSVKIGFRQRGCQALLFRFQGFNASGKGLQFTLLFVTRFTSGLGLMRFFHRFGRGFRRG